MSHSNQWVRVRRWPRIGERVLLAGRHPFAGQEATVLRLEKPWGLKLFGVFPRVRTDGGREDYLYLYTEWVIGGDAAAGLTREELRRERNREAARRWYERKKAAKKAAA